MKSLTIKINKKTFKLGFGLEVFLKLGEIWNLETLEEVNEKFQVLTVVNNDGKTPLKNIKTISEIIEGVIAANDENTEIITASEIRKLPLDQFQEVVINLVQGLVKNSPQPTKEETEKK
jgi:hypothetical protein